MTRGRSKTTVAVVDTGVATSHPALAPNAWSNLQAGGAARPRHPVHGAGVDRRPATPRATSLAVDKAWSFRTLATVTAFPSPSVIEAGTRRSGNYARCAPTTTGI